MPPAAPPSPPSPPALAVIEVSSIARGVVCADAMVKRAPVRLLQSHPTSPGKHVIVLDGEVAEVEEALDAALIAAAKTLVDKLFLPQAHPSLAPLIAARTHGAAAAVATAAKDDSVAIFEVTTICAAVLAADAAAKAARIVLLDLRLAQGIGGKASFTMAGPLEDVDAAVQAAQGAIEHDLFVAAEIIPSPHADLRGKLIF